MKTYILYLISILTLFSCGEKEPVKIQEKTIKKVSIEKMKKAKPDKLSSKNVVEKLTKYGEENKETKAVIETTFGNIYVTLFDDTPLHRASFVMLAKKGFYDNTYFYRIHKNFVIQGGNSDSEETADKLYTIGNYRIPPEPSSNNIHKKGALALAVPEIGKDNLHGNWSSPYNFYIVQGYKYTSRTLKRQEKEYGFKVPEKHREAYYNIGGAPHLDGKYTVFGEVTKGLDVVDKIAEIKTNTSDYPEKEVYLSVKILK